jgi:adenosylcobinamide kinase/adenosylcobinamide-phosphate guanylyltransferase
MLTLILGGARSGKSALAERLAVDSGLDVLYIATAQALDGEMSERIAHHRARRPESWGSVEEPLALANVLHERARADRFLLVDCLTLWLSNLIGIDEGVHLTSQRDTFLDIVSRLPGEIVFVSNEVGLGITPLGELTRRFVDEAGRLHQALAQRCDRVVFVAAGLPLTLKGTPP